MQTSILLTIAIATAAIAQLFFKKGVSTLGEVPFTGANVIKMIITALTNPWIFTGMVSLGVGFVLYLFVLSKLDLSTTYPITISLQIIIITLVSWWWLHETLSGMQMLGITVVIAGLFLITKP